MKAFPLTLLLAAGLAFGSAVVRAQDVIIGSPVWSQQTPVAEKLPQLRGSWRPVYPTRLAASYTGYAFVFVTIEADGKRSRFGSRATQPELAESVGRASRELEMKPAMTGGKAVKSSVWLPVIFNAANTNPKKPDAAPRLLAVAPLVLPDGAPPPGPIWATVQLDDTGAVTGAPVFDDAGTESFRPQIESALAQWRFAPARRAAKSVAAPMHVVFLTLPPMGPPPPLAAKSNEVRPKSLSRPPPDVRLRGRKGYVAVGFDVETDGRVTHAVATETNDPEMAEMVLKDLAQWKFQPGTRDGIPVKMHETTRVSFTGSIPAGGREAYQVTGTPESIEKMPPELRFDVAPKPRVVTNPVYPYARLRENLRGHATVVMQIDATGIVTGTRIVDETHPDFGQALLASAARLKFDPALRDGRPTATIIRQGQEFYPSNGSPLLDATDLRLLRREKSSPESIVGGPQLDTPLRPIANPVPRAPLSLTGTTGTALVEFLVDETGRARLPRIASATEPGFGYAAVQAVADWRFEPPLVAGKPAVVRVRAPFNFAPSNAPGPTTKSN